jgi:hypothetical protein
MVRPRKLMLVAGAAAAAVAVMRRGRHGTRGHNVAGGILVGDAVLYDRLSRLLLGPLVKRSPPTSRRSSRRRPDSQGRLRARSPIAPAGPSARVRGDRPRPGPSHDRSSPRQRRPARERRPAPALVSRRGRGRAGVPRRLVRPGRQHPVDAPLGRPGGRPGRDWPRAAPGWPGAHLGLPARHPAPSLRATPRAPARSGRAPARRSAPDGERTPWRWPWRFALTQRIELVHADGAPGHAGP